MAVPSWPKLVFCPHDESIIYLEKIFISVGGHLTVGADLLLGPLVYPLVLAEVEAEGLHVADLGLRLDHVDRLMVWLSLACGGGLSEKFRLKIFVAISKD